MDDRYDTVRGGRPETEVLSDLRSRLRGAAHTHVPDRERMLARVEQGMAEPAGRPEPLRGNGRGGHRSPMGPAPWARVVGVTAGLVGAFGIGGLAVGLTTHRAEEQRQTVVTSSDPAAAPDVPSPTVLESHRPVRPSPTSGKSETAPSSSTPSTGTHPPSASPTATATSPGSPDARRGNHPQDDYLWSDGSVDPSGNDYWAQSDVTLKTEKPMTQLTVTLRIARTAGVSSTGAWSTLSGDDYSLTVTKDDDAIVYRWTLKSGKTIPAGTHVFAGQYNHAQGGRDAGGDVYAAQGDGPSGAVEVRGDFY